ncbi:MAG: outer membrane protein assembly factor BamA [Candidatus Latescibacteria bacterium]|jgi:outer membrane protein insertion porin family|nr:outer membrane protein assembly factor BamA [Gemmatimonadaceae bacterium]MDP7450466.1 outer membrane protein assembly factor BamA [Candidatus Latescibacterota bacterium]MDP7632461.1 outer membrane protein assembly factor BamA [Candidatus Latescibacterota bacterium]HJP32354.1 outer membrane protein assembly factor BamA [Candidatus Latescibacterota bacterium]
MYEARSRYSERLGTFLFCVLLAVPCLAQTTVQEVEIRGDFKRVAESLIRSTIGLQPGVELSQENVQEAVRALQGLHVFSDIQLYADDSEAGPGVKLIVVVREHPSLEGVRFKGNKEIKEKDMKEAVGLVAGQVVAPKDVARGRQRILELYSDKGYLRAQVEGQLFDADEEGTVFVQFDIDEGDKVKIAAVNVIGNKAIDSGKIRKQMETKPKRWWRKAEFKADIYQEDKERVLAFYRSEGYQQARIARDSIYYDDSRRRLFIDLEIEEGEQYFVGDVTWEGNELFGAEELAGQLRVGEGDVFQFSSPELAYLAKSAYYERGYLDTEIIPRETIRGDSIDVSFQVFEGEPWKIRRIDFTGNVKTREKVLRREVALLPGDVFKSSQLEESQRRLYMLGYFKDVQFQQHATPSVDDDKFIDLAFSVEEQRTGAASMGAGYSDRDKLVGTIGLQVPNFRGMGQNLDFSWEFGTRREQFLIGFTEPWLFDTPTSFSFRVYTLNQQYFDSFDFHRNSVSVRVGRRLKRPAYSSVSLGYELRDERYSDFQTGYDQSSPSFTPRTTSSLELVFRRDTRDLPDFPTNGSVISYTPEVASSFIAGDVDFHRHELNVNVYRPSFWKFVLAVESKFSIIDGFSDWDDDNISFWDRFTPGGVDWWDGQVRGYPDASLGPRDAQGRNTGGRSMMTVNVEYRFPITERQVIGLLFADAGNAWTRVDDFNPTDLKRSVGVGFRVMTPMLGMIGFDFGYGFDRRSVDGQRPGLSTHFQFGPRFF